MGAYPSARPRHMGHGGDEVSSVNGPSTAAGSARAGRERFLAGAGRSFGTRVPAGTFAEGVGGFAALGVARAFGLGAFRAEAAFLAFATDARSAFASVRAVARAAFSSARWSRVGHSGLMQSVHGGRPASMAVTTGARQTGHGGWSFSSLPRCGSG